MSYSLIKAFHIISVMAWMCGLLYLPRLFVYHSRAEVGGELSQTLKIMERRLLRWIMNPAMICAYIFGLWMLQAHELWVFPWMHVKLTAIIILTIYHQWLGLLRKDFEKDQRNRSSNFYRLINEIPTVLMIIIVIMCVVKPFS